jgi:hypothetical protein
MKNHILVEIATIVNKLFKSILKTLILLIFITFSNLLSAQTGKWKAQPLDFNNNNALCGLICQRIF